MSIAAQAEPEGIAGQVLDLVGAEGYIHGFICVRPPCGPLPTRIRAASLTRRADGSVVHKASGYQVGTVTRSGHGGWSASHASDGSQTVHGTQGDALKAIARHYQGPSASSARSAPAPVKAAPAPARAAQPPPSPMPATAATAPAPASKGKPLTGMGLWMSGEGVTLDVTEAERKAARNVWYKNTFSYTNNYLRDGTLPSASEAAQIRKIKGTGTTYGIEKIKTGMSDADYIRDIGILRGMMNRAPAFSRPAVMYRSVSESDQVFGPVGSMKGRTFTDPGFMSATADKDSAERYGNEDEAGHPDPTADKIIINVPAGGHAMRSQALFSPDHAREKEYTFPPGTRFRVDDDRMVGGMRQTTVSQILPPGAKPGSAPVPVQPQIKTREFFQAYPGHKYNVETGELVS